MFAQPVRTLRVQRGFSLVEVLVGMFIGLIAIVIMMQMTENAEQRKRTTAAGSDAQIAGSIALYTLERDIRLAGYGFGAAAELGCTVSAYDNTRTGTGIITFPLAAVRIIDGASGAPDQIEVLYGNSPTMAIAQAYSATAVTSKTIASTSTRTGLQRGDLVIAGDSGQTTCRLIEITDNTNADAATVNHANGNYTNQSGVAVAARYNPAAGWSMPSAAGNLYNLGPRANPRLDVWRIQNTRFLVVSDELHYVDANPADGANDVSEIAEGIVDLQAQYGIDSDGDFQVNGWSTTTPTNYTGWVQVVAVRVALLARSQQYERTDITTAAPTWNGGAFTMRNADGSADSNPDSPNNWRRYRYRVYETVIPLRNMVWGITP